jgi:hypothetical protein
MSAPENLHPLHESFTWLPDSIRGDRNAQFVAKAIAVSYGSSAIANLVRKNSMAADNGDQPLLSGSDLDCLVGLLIFSVDTLRDAAEDQIDHLQAAALKGAKK